MCVPCADRLSQGVVDVALGAAVVGHRAQAVLLVPDQRAAAGVLFRHPAGLVAVGVVGKAPVVDLRRRVGLGARIGVGPVVGGLGLRQLSAFGRHPHMRLALVGDVVDGVIGHRQRVALLLVARALPGAARAGQPVELVVAEALADRPAQAAGLGQRHLVVQAGDVADRGRQTQAQAALRPRNAGDK